MNAYQIHILNRPGKKYLPPFVIKDYEARTIPVPNWVMKILEEIKETCGVNNPFLFLSRERYKRIQKIWQKYSKENRTAEWRNTLLLNNYQRAFQSTCKRAGISTPDQLTVHCLRKSYGTNLAELGTPVHTLKELMGHSSIVTTQKYYLKSTDANKKKAVEGLDRMMREEGLIAL